MATIHNVGPDEISEFGCECYVWVVADYTCGDYDGSGYAVSFDGTQYRMHNLSHCSCYGTEEGMQQGDVIDIASVVGDSIEHECSAEFVAKVRSLI